MALRVHKVDDVEVIWFNYSFKYDGDVVNGFRANQFKKYRFQDK